MITLKNITLEPLELFWGIGINAKKIADKPAYTAITGMDSYMIDDNYAYDGVKSDAGNGINTHVVLYIVIGVCAILGIVLGIFAGKRAANK